MSDLTVRRIRPLSTAILLCFSLLMAACAKPPSDASANLEINSRTLQPADSELAGIYNRSCRSCHTVAATGAPLTGDVAGWQPRLDKGMDALLDSVVNGFGGMPPFGLCMDCDAQQFEALIVFMASAPSES